MNEFKNEADGTIRKEYYGALGKQPWDSMVIMGIAPYFAAGNVLKYLRRVKEGQEEHSLHSAQWYYKRLWEARVSGLGPVTSFECHTIWMSLQAELKGPELALLGDPTDH